METNKIINNADNNEEELNIAKNNFQKKKTSLKIIFKQLLILFLLFNMGVVIFVGTIPNIGRPYFPQKVMMRTAASINFFYILPLSKVFGYKNMNEIKQLLDNLIK